MHDPRVVEASGGREASMRDETASRVTNSRYHANPSSDRVCFSPQCNDLTFHLSRRSRARRWNKSRQRARVSKVRTDPIFHFCFSAFRLL
jgi:hypothetical protein